MMTEGKKKLRGEEGEIRKVLKVHKYTEEKKNRKNNDTERDRKNNYNLVVIISGCVQ